MVTTVLFHRYVNEILKCFIQHTIVSTLYNKFLCISTNDPNYTRRMPQIDFEKQLPKTDSM